MTGGRRGEQIQARGGPHEQAQEELAMAKNTGKSKKPSKKVGKLPKGKQARAQAWKGTRASWKDRPKVKRDEFDEEMERLQVELVKLQEWVKATGAKICVVFEGRDTAGKGSLIRRITERVSPRVFAWSRCSRLPSGRGRRCISSAIWRTSRPRERSCSSIAAGTTGRASSG